MRGTQRELELPASRGKILDRNGQVIATSLEAKSVIAYNDTVPDDLSADKVQKLASLLQISEYDLRKKLKEERKQVFLKRQVDPDVAKETARRAAREEGMLVGISSGATLAAIAQKLPDLPAGSRVLGFNYDTGERYLSVPDFLPVE